MANLAIAVIGIIALSIVALFVSACIKACLTELREEDDR